MATQKFTQAALAASVNNGSSPFKKSPADVYRSAMGALNEIFDDQETVCSIAIAGANNAGENAACERRLFEVIQKMTGDIALLNELRADLNALAQLAGLQVEVQP